MPGCGTHYVPTGMESKVPVVGIFHLYPDRIAVENFEKRYLY